MVWKTVEKPGYMGRIKDELIARWNSEYGKGNWRLMYVWGQETISRDDAIQLYEDGYYEYFKNNPDELNWLVENASDIYDTAQTNVGSGFDYTKQETINNHIHDISIRRAVMRLGQVFKGDRLIHVRGPDTEGFKVNPGCVPFHLPEKIEKDDVKDYGDKGHWWKKDTIEDFYQKNKVLQVKE